MARDLLPVTPIRSISRAPAPSTGPAMAWAISDEHGAFLFDQDREYIGADVNAATANPGTQRV